MKENPKTWKFYSKFAGSLCSLPADNGPCLSEIQDALSPAKKTSLTQACANYLSDLQNSCSIQTTSSNFQECKNICGKFRLSLSIVVGYF